VVRILEGLKARPEGRVPAGTDAIAEQLV